ncbi:fimbrillin family protein, partial [Bacteroides heparinolyticus]|uniref:fimbrillin family protein n=1 Tax=Prevotella heparinolytica TaxID=28113 RepID=UPI0028F09AF5
VADQKDLLVAASTDKPGNTSTAEPLTMKHALTAVRFVTGDDMLAGTVSKITLKNVYGTGSLPLQASAAWNNRGGARNFELTLSPAATAPDPQLPGTELTPEAVTFMMLPQTLPAGAQIEVKYTDGLTNTPRTLTANIAGKTWPMGKTVTYRISTSSIVITPTLEVTPPADYTYQGGNGSYTVKSYASVAGGGGTTNVPIAWEVEYSTDNGVSWNSNKPAWLTAFTESGAGGTSAASYTATVAAQVNSAPADPHNEALRNATPVNDGTNTNIYDLSTHDGQGNTVPMRTANCYIVNAAGRYRLPLAYGNAVDYVKVPATGNNTSAYISSASPASYILSRFINHLGSGITDPYIYNNTSCVPASCKLIWQDEKDLVTGVALSADGHFLEFTVGQSTIHQGNAVVAVYNASNTVLWSWHIWVTDYKLGTGLKTITNYQHHNYTLMPVNLGWCDGNTEIYAERTVQVRFKQKPTAGYTPAATQTFTVKQKAHTITYIGNNTYYQWGRKDPIAGGIFDGGTYKNKTWYDATGNLHTTHFPTSNFSSHISCIISCIKKPGNFNLNYDMDDKYYNLWDANNNTISITNNPVVKTIYDPCPAGYKLSPPNAYTGFSKTGGSVSSVDQMNVQQPWKNGWNFYCSPSSTSPGSPTVFFPASGYCHPYNANCYNDGSIGYYWSMKPRSQTTANDITLGQSSVGPTSGASKGHGFTVRAIQE